MQIKNITNYNNKPSFGLKIQNDDGLQNLTKYLKKHHSESSVSDFMNELREMRFLDEKKNDTTIVFDKVKRGYRFSQKAICDESGIHLVGEKEPYDYIIYELKNTKNEVDFMKNKCVLSDTTLKETLKEIASNYAEFYYSKK